jgi:hypothetical protein
MTRILLAVVAAVALLPGHAGSSSPAPAGSPVAPPSAPSGHVMAMCPLSVDGTQALAADVPGGETLTFTTDTGPIGELRERVKAMATIHNQQHDDVAARQGRAGRGMAGSGNAMSGTEMPTSWATFIEVESGAAILVVPVDPADLHALRNAIRLRAQRLREQGCEIMGQTWRMAPGARA